MEIKSPPIIRKEMDHVIKSSTPALPSRRHPTHQPTFETPNRSVIVFITLCTKDRRSLLANDQIHDWLLRAWKLAADWSVGAYVIMPDHAHLFCAPGKWPVTPLKRWISYWKSLVARAVVGSGPLAEKTVPSMTADIQKSTSLWQSDFWDTQLRKGESYSEKWAYVRNNPVRAGLVKSPELWPYLGVVNTLPWHD